MSKPLESYDKTGAESTTARLFVWDASVDLIKENFWFGVGTGDIKDELRQSKLGKVCTGIAQMNLNSRNQFLIFHAASGVFRSLFLQMAIVSMLFNFNPVLVHPWR